MYLCNHQACFIVMFRRQPLRSIVMHLDFGCVHLGWYRKIKVSFRDVLEKNDKHENDLKQFQKFIRIREKTVMLET